MNKSLRYILLLFISITALNLSAQVDGLMYSMTFSGGNSLDGTINKFDPLNYKDTTTVNFDIANGYQAFGNFIQLSNGMLYGMTSAGDTGVGGGYGDIIQYNIQTGKDSILYNFTTSGWSTGQFPYGSLCHATNDTLYGMTYYGGEPYNQGVVFCFNYHTGVYQVLDTLLVGTGVDPTGSFIQASNGVLYGLTTNNYLPGSIGTIFSYNIQTRDTQIVYTFTGAPDGQYPRGNLIQASNGILYGLTEQGGTQDSGTLFSYNIGTRTETVLVSFAGYPADGSSPEESLMQASDGNLYGTTSGGGAYADGTLFKYDTTTHTETVLYNFNGSDTDGAAPYDDLIQASDGLLYGNTNLGGANGLGTIFCYNISTNTKKNLFSYNNTNGGNPYGDLLEVMSTSIVAVNNHCPTDNTGSLTVNVRGGKLPYTYSWSNGATTSSITNLASGYYTDTVRDAKGITMYTQDTVKPLSMVLSFYAGNPCIGSTKDSAAVSVSGGTAPYSYSWALGGQTTDSIYDVAAGTYTCTISDAHSCPAMGTVTITQAAALTIDSLVAVNRSCPTCNDGKITVYVSGGIPPGDSVYYNYLWNTNGTYDTITNLDSGSYYVCVTSPYGCSASVCDTTMVLTTGIQNLTGSGNLVKVYPVPSSGLITINLTGEGLENIEITDALGRQVYKQTLSPQMNSNTLNIDLGGQADGVYILYINSRQGVLTRKILIQK